MWWEQDRLEGKVSGQYGHAFSFDPSITIGGVAAPCVFTKWTEMERRDEWVNSHDAH